VAAAQLEARREADAELASAREAFAREATARRQAEAERDAARGALAAAEAAAGFAEVNDFAAQAAEVDLADTGGWSDMVPPLTAEDFFPEGQFQYLFVSATLNGLLPEDLTPFLIPGAVLVRREGRLSALLAVRCAGDGNVPSPEGEEQARRLEARSLRVGWAAEAS
jgi:hypothetical protein